MSFLNKRKFKILVGSLVRVQSQLRNHTLTPTIKTNTKYLCSYAPNMLCPDLRFFDCMYFCVPYKQIKYFVVNHIIDPLYVSAMSSTIIVIT
jgi:hypothetical protein